VLLELQGITHAVEYGTVLILRRDREGKLLTLKKYKPSTADFNYSIEQNLSEVALKWCNVQLDLLPDKEKK